MSLERKCDNDIWTHILKENFPDYDYVSDLRIDAKIIKKSKESWEGRIHQFEPRILCKHDSLDKLPNIFRNNGLSLLSIKNGEYLLTTRKIFIQLPKNEKEIINITTKHNSRLLLVGNSETSLLDNLKWSGVLEDIIGEPIIIGPVLGGRHRCTFTTFLGETEVSVKGSQYETDGVYETDNYYVIIEVKNIDSDTFNIRQLYYPSRTIYDETNGLKKIMALFICKDNDNIIKIYKYGWPVINEMTNIICEDFYRYKF